MQKKPLKFSYILSNCKKLVQLFYQDKYLSLSRIQRSLKHSKKNNNNNNNIVVKNLFCRVPNPT